MKLQCKNMHFFVKQELLEPFLHERSACVFLHLTFRSYCICAANLRKNAASSSSPWMMTKDRNCSNNCWKNHCTGQCVHFICLMSKHRFYLPGGNVVVRCCSLPCFIYTTSHVFTQIDQNKPSNNLLWQLSFFI